MTLKGKNVLLVEDNYIVSIQIAHTLQDLGLNVIGPFATVKAAEKQLEADELALTLAVAVLDVNVRGDSTLQLAERLRAQGVPCAFVTGYDPIPQLPSSLGDVPMLSKPLDPSALSEVLLQLCSASFNPGQVP